MAPLWDWEIGLEARRRNWKKREQTAARLCEMFGVDGFEIDAAIIWYREGCWFCWNDKDGRAQAAHVPHPRWGLETHEMAELAVKVKLTTCL